MTLIIKKSSWYYFLFVCLVFLALILISWDYVYGHHGESIIKPNTCPLCTAFNSFMFSQLFTALLLVLLLKQLRQFHGFIASETSLSPLSIYIADFSPRSPPFSL